MRQLRTPARSAENCDQAFPRPGWRCTPYTAAGGAAARPSQRRLRRKHCPALFLRPEHRHDQKVCASLREEHAALAAMLRLMLMVQRGPKRDTETFFRCCGRCCSTWTNSRSGCITPKKPDLLFPIIVAASAEVRRRDRTAGS